MISLVTQLVSGQKDRNRDRTHLLTFEPVLNNLFFINLSLNRSAMLARVILPPLPFSMYAILSTLQNYLVAYLVNQVVWFMMSHNVYSS